MADTGMGFPSYHLPGQGAKKAKPPVDHAPNVAKLQQEQTQKTVGVSYICGNCGAEVELKASDNVRCRECGHRILYKKRTTMGMMYEAR